MKIAIVTGASSGVGREAIIQIADRSEGINEIWVIARRKERPKELDGHTPVTLRCFGLDVTDSDDLKVLGIALKENKPDVKLLINSAGYGKIGNVEDAYLEDETGMIQISCQALCAMAHMVLPYMGKDSRILQFASSAAFLPQPRFAIYAATKSFVLNYSHALEAELRNRGIFVTVVCPGPVKAKFFGIVETAGHIPLYRRLVMADPRKVVRLASRDSVTGKPLSIYGFTMKGFYVLSKILSHSWLLYLTTYMKS